VDWLLRRRPSLEDLRAWRGASWGDDGNIVAAMGLNASAGAGSRRRRSRTAAHQTGTRRNRAPLAPGVARLERRPLYRIGIHQRNG
jgi:hypothetical protein